MVMPLGQYFRQQREAFSPYVESGFLKLSFITNAILSFTPVKHCYMGYRQFFHATELQKISVPNTKEILRASLTSNVLNYLLPVIVYRSAVNAIRENYTEGTNADYAVMLLDYAILGTIVSRLYFRRLADNIFYSVALPRAISKDVKEHVAEIASEFAARGILDIYARYLDQATVKSHVNKILQRRLKNVFMEYLFKVDRKALKSLEFITAVRSVILGLPKNLFLEIHYERLLQNDLAFHVANTLVSAYANFFSENHHTQLKNDIDELNKNLQKISFQSLEDSSAEMFVKNLEKGFARLTEFLPINHLPDCGCNLKKILHAGVSSPVYYSANHFIATLPEQFAKYQWITPATLFYANLFMIPASILIYGQSFNEYKVATENHCTRHRYIEFARHKAHSFGVGLAFFSTWKLLAKMLFTVTGVDNYFVQDALLNLMMQFGAVSMLAFNDALPGKQLRPWDVFKPTRKLTRGLIAWFRLAYKDEPLPEDEDVSALSQLFSVLGSQEFRVAVNMIFSGSEYFPRSNLLSSHIMDANKQLCADPRQVFFEMQSFKLFLKHYKADIEGIIPWLNSFHYYSSWVPTDLLAMLPVPGFMALLVDVLELMKNESLTDIIKSRKLDEFLLFYRKELEPDESTVTLFHHDEVEEMLHDNFSPPQLRVGLLTRETSRLDLNLQNSHFDGHEQALPSETPAAIDDGDAEFYQVGVLDVLKPRPNSSVLLRKSAKALKETSMWGKKRILEMGATHLEPLVAQFRPSQ
jgi:hypothetical protein